MASINPIVPGFAPDPSVVKVGEWFYLVNSSFHMFPGLPIYCSKDLLSWKQIGNAICRPGQLSLAKADTRVNDIMLSTGGLYAPTIRHHSGVFYVICTNIIHHREVPGDPVVEAQNFIVSTTDIWAGEWSDPVYFNFQGIDPSFLFDDDGRVYIQGSRGPGPYTKIVQFEINLATAELLSPEKVVWTGTGGTYPEGPHVYKLDGWYCLLISEGGTHESHMITMARSKNVWGPYDPCPHNPILTARGKDEYIQFTGHLDAFQDDGGSWWGTCLGARRDPQGRFIMGRETFLTRGRWEDGWFSFETVKEDPEGLKRSKDSIPLSALPQVDLLYIRDPDLSRYRNIEEGKGSLSIILDASPADLSSPNISPTFIGKRQRHLNGTSHVTINKVRDLPSTTSVKTGLAIYKDEHRYTRIYYDSAESVIVSETVNAKNKLSKIQRCGVKPVDAISLRIAYTEQTYQLLYKVSSDNTEGYLCLMTVDTLDLTDRDFVGPVVGIFATAGVDGTAVELSGFSVQ